MCQLAGLVMGLLLASGAPAFACSYPYAPEPVGGPSATFIARRMVEAAAHVDLAIAETAAPVRLPGSDQVAAQSVTFRVVERLKGASPDRFTLFAQTLRSANHKPEPEPLLHWVDEATGTVTPHSTRWEMPVAESSGFSTCDPGFIEPVQGRAYLIFREADGSLLGPVEFHPGQRPSRGFAFVEASLPADTEWGRAVRVESHPESRARRAARAAQAGQPAVSPEPVATDPSRGSVGFRRLLTESEARTLLQRAGARPYVVYMTVGGLSGVHRRPPEEASLDTIAGARRQAVATLGSPAPRGGLIARVRAVLDAYDADTLARDAHKLDYARALIAADEQEKATMAAARSDGPFVYGVEFVGGPEVQGRLRASPMVAGIHPGFRVRGRLAAHQPDNPADDTPRAPGLPAAVQALTAAEVYARLQALAAP